MKNLIIIRIISFPLACLPYRAIQQLGKGLGLLGYYCMTRFRKRTLSNLALANELQLSPAELTTLAKKSFQNFMITGLEYSKLAEEKHIDRLAIIENPEVAENIVKQGKSIIFFGGHQANWEVLFLAITQRMPGVAIGRPLKNKTLYNWVIKMREQYGGKIISPNHAIKEGLRALKKGLFLGIVGDQGMPNSGYSSPFLGRRAFTSSMPALLAYRTGCPIIVTTIKRVDTQYRIHYSDPIWPQQEQLFENEIDRMMRQTLSILEKSIKEIPEQWLWQHNRWKQKTDRHVKITYRQEAILLILPENCQPFYPHLKMLRTLYPLAFITVMLPVSCTDFPTEMEMEPIYYTDMSECFILDFRFKLLFNFTNNINLTKHFKRLSVFHAFSMPDPEQVNFEVILNNKHKKEVNSG
ncbi:MAG: hypothetical protein HKM04_00375 [Legionellales bacterium]|nr:hypothetical protein [Legionellales bacterium]